MPISSSLVDESKMSYLAKHHRLAVLSHLQEISAAHPFEPSELSQGLPIESLC